MHSFSYCAPLSVSEAVELLAKLGSQARLLAGGTDLLPQMKERRLHPSHVVSIRRISQLQGVSTTNNGGRRIGAGTTLVDLTDSPLLTGAFRLLLQGTGIIGSPQIRNRATLGGNICNAAPSADSMPPLLCLDAVAEIVGPSGERQIPLSDFITGPGRTGLEVGEILRSVVIPPQPPRFGGSYRRHCPRKEMDIAVVGVGASMALAPNGSIEHARIALASVSPTPLRVPAAEALLEGQIPNLDLFAHAADLAVEASSPISDARGSADFRRTLVRSLTVRVLGLAAIEATSREGGH